MNIISIKDNYAGEKGWKSFQWAYNNNLTMQIDFDEIAKRYAEACCKATLEKAAENAQAYLFDHLGIDVPAVAKGSILNPSNIVLL